MPEQLVKGRETPVNAFSLPPEMFETPSIGSTPIGTTRDEAIQITTSQEEGA